MKFLNVETEKNAVEVRPSEINLVIKYLLLIFKLFFIKFIKECFYRIDH